MFILSTWGMKINFLLKNMFFMQIPGKMGEKAGGRQARKNDPANTKKWVFQKCVQNLKNVNLELS